MIYNRVPKSGSRGVLVNIRFISVIKGWRVIYNRVPKSGSRGVLETTALLSRELGYNYVNSKIYAPNYLFNDTEVKTGFFKYNSLYYSLH